MTDSFFDGVRDLSTERPDGRIVAWSEFGDEEGLALLRVPGTPGCRFSLRADRTPWTQRHLRVITTERPGFGASSRMFGRGFRQPADDLAAILDHLVLDTVHVIGGSGSAPHQLAFAAHHPHRVRAMTVLVGAAPVRGDEIDQMIGINAVGYRLVQQGDVEGLRGQWSRSEPPPSRTLLRPFERPSIAPQQLTKLLCPTRSGRRARPSHGKKRSERALDGRADEAIALYSPWDDFDLDAIGTSVTWWHAPKDANAPLSAAVRVVEQLPNARLVQFGQDEGHLAAYHREGEILDELLTRG